MQYRTLGRSGLQLSVIGFGCGNVGGLMVRGRRQDQVAAVERAVELGINYFDTASSYGDGWSETNLGEVLRELKPNVYVGTKVHLRDQDRDDLRNSVVREVDASLKRLGRDSVDLIQLHDRVAAQWPSGDRLLYVEDALGEVLQAFGLLQFQGKVRFYGITGMGDTEALHRVIEEGAVYSVQTVYNLLNPSAGASVTAGFYAQDFGKLLERAARQGAGALVIRALAAGALADAPERHPVAGGNSPMGSSADYSEDVEKATRFRFLVDDGFADTSLEAALRFPLGHAAVSTVLVGFSSVAQVEQAVVAAEKGPLPAAVLPRLQEAWAGFSGSR